MRHITYLLFVIVSSHAANAQDYAPIELNEAQRMTYLRGILPLDSYCVHYEYDEEDGDIVEAFMQMHDPNFTFYANKHDTLAIFDAKLCGGHEAGKVNVYSFLNGIPSTRISRSGKISAINQDTIWMHTYPCCASFLNVITPFSLETGEQVGDAHVFYSRKDAGWISPVKTTPKQHYIVREGTTLHFSPSLTDQAEVLSNDWVLIRLDDMKTEEGFCLNEYYTRLIGRDTYILYAWIQAGDVQWE
jgi:hypothetical protein